MMRSIDTIVGVTSGGCVNGLVKEDELKLVSDSNCGSYVLDMLADSDDIAIKCLVAKHKNATDNTLCKLLINSDEQLKLSLAMRVNGSDEFYEKLLENASLEVLYRVVSNVSVPFRLIEPFLGHDDDRLSKLSFDRLARSLQEISGIECRLFRVYRSSNGYYNRSDRNSVRFDFLNFLESRNCPSDFFNRLVLTSYRDHSIRIYYDGITDWPGAVYGRMKKVMIANHQCSMFVFEKYFECFTDLELLSILRRSDCSDIILEKALVRNSVKVNRAIIKHPNCSERIFEVLLQKGNYRDCFYAIMIKHANCTLDISRQLKVLRRRRNRNYCCALLGLAVICIGVGIGVGYYIGNHIV